MSRFGTLKDIRTDEGNDHSDDEDQPGQQSNQYYAGGSERSGQLIEDPNKSKDAIIKNMFSQARRNGATVVDEAPKAPKKFSGAGNRLGNGETPSTSATENNAASNSNSNSNNNNDDDDDEEEQTESVTHVLTFWRNGFSVNDGPFRSFDDPNNKQFLDDINRGLSPRELLVNATRPTEVSINLVDRRNEDYKPPKKEKVPFAGSGFRLGTPTPNVAGAGETALNNTTTTTTNTAPTTTTTTSSVANALPPRNQLQIDETQPTTSIQIRLADGTRLVSKFNHTHTVGDIRNFIASARPSNSNFTLLTTFPNREITDNSLTIAAANLLNAVIVQKLI